jgi:hypothetical protein
MTENERFGLVFAKTGSINSGTCAWVSFYSFYVSLNRVPQREAQTNFVLYFPFKGLLQFMYSNLDRNIA